MHIEAADIVSLGLVWRSITTQWIPSSRSARRAPCKRWLPPRSSSTSSADSGKLSFIYSEMVESIAAILFLLVTHILLHFPCWFLLFRRVTEKQFHDPLLTIEAFRETVRVILLPAYYDDSAYCSREIMYLLSTLQLNTNYCKFYYLILLSSLVCFAAGQVLAITCTPQQPGV